MIMSNYSHMLNIIMKIVIMILLVILMSLWIIFISHVKSNCIRFIIMEQINNAQLLNPDLILKCMLKKKMKCLMILKESFKIHEEVTSVKTMWKIVLLIILLMGQYSINYLIDCFFLIL